jgi:hypothetical protein
MEVKVIRQETETKLANPIKVEQKVIVNGKEEVPAFV